MNQNETYIKRCIELAKMGFPAAMPNPSVGAVLVYKDTIIGEGYTSAYGGHHAEVNAIAAVKDKLLISEATLYVSLEPCCHFGKTPPCADLIIQNKIRKVVIGTLDPNDKVAGKGVQKLHDAGIEVVIGVLERDCYEINKRFFTFINKKRPYIILKWAESYDGFIAPKNQKKMESFLISNEISRQLVHKWRSEEQAILVGTTTVLKDNPTLNVRDWTGKNPIRIVLDRTNKIIDTFAVKDNVIKTIVITEKENLKSTENIDYEIVTFDNQLITSICAVLYKHKIQSVLIEGGTKTIQSFIDANLWDEAQIFKSDVLLLEGCKAPTIEIQKFEKTNVLNDELVKFYNYD